jgi:hypothetical protein
MRYENTQLRQELRSLERQLKAINVRCMVWFLTTK